MAKQTTKKRATTKRTTKPRHIYQKKMVLTLTGDSKAAIQRVASKIHATATEETTGGSTGRRVQITSENPKSPVRTVYYGNV